MSITLKPSRPPFFLFHVILVKGMLFNWFKFEIGATMATMFFKAIEIGIFQNILYLSHHIANNIFF